MAITSPIDQSPELEAARPPRAGRWWAAAREFGWRRPLGAVGAVVIIIMLVVAAFATLIAPYDPLTVDFGAMLTPPNAQHWLGTDAFGRDVLT
ncbi:MAG: hypothetical protein ACREJE_01475, partial [Candidatus Rokuibacteriota bacterium]